MEAYLGTVIYTMEIINGGFSSQTLLSKYSPAPSPPTFPWHGKVQTLQHAMDFKQ
jgi:hypothetical protein